MRCPYCGGVAAVTETTGAPSYPGKFQGAQQGAPVPAGPSAPAQGSQPGTAGGAATAENMPSAPKTFAADGRLTQSDAPDTTAEPAANRFSAGGMSETDPASAQTERDGIAELSAAPAPEGTGDAEQPASAPAEAGGTEQPVSAAPAPERDGGAEQSAPAPAKADGAEQPTPAAPAREEGTVPSMQQGYFPHTGGSCPPPVPPAQQYAQPNGGQPYPHYYQQPVRPRKTGVAPLVLGIISLLTCFWCIIGLPVSIVGLVLGVKERAEAGGVATAGMVLSIIGLVLSVLIGLLLVFVGWTAALFY